MFERQSRTGRGGGIDEGCQRHLPDETKSVLFFYSGARLRGDATMFRQYFLIVSEIYKILAGKLIFGKFVLTLDVLFAPDKAAQKESDSESFKTCIEYF